MIIKKFENLPPRILDVIHLSGSLARKADCKAFLVGGFVRDLILGVENFDIDIVIEGDGIVFASLIADKLKARLVTHNRFGTATILCPDKLKIDIATARKEIYERPAALPEVNFGSIKDDLARRDFSINSMAIDINENNFGELMDFFKGQADLKNKTVRILHDQSFFDDPTRILRAIRFEQRYGFKIEQRTLALLKKAVKSKMLNKTQEQRLRDELVLILQERDPVKCLKRIDVLCGFSFINRNISFNKETGRLLCSAQRYIQWFKDAFPKRRRIDSWLVYFIALLDEISVSEIEDICKRFALRKGDRLRIISYKKNNIEIIKRLSRDTVTISSIYRILDPLSYEVILFVLSKAKNKNVQRRVEEFIVKYNGIRISVSGKDLSDLGLAAGPDFKNILNRVLYAKINGKVLTREDEIKFIKNQIR